jgi:hypothetical protein
VTRTSRTPRRPVRRPRVAALAADAEVARFAGRALASWELAREYDLDDVDGRRPDWGAHAVAIGLG